MVIRFVNSLHSTQFNEVVLTECSYCSSNNYNCGGCVERWDTDRRTEGKFSRKTMSLHGAGQALHERARMI